jgi:hypothetical protein
MIYAVGLSVAGVVAVYYVLSRYVKTLTAVTVDSVYRAYCSYYYLARLGPALQADGRACGRVPAGAGGRVFRG